ncbi:MAG TPA: hypothetical protein VLC95_07845 [Anaerolineae bacterium]|nr:hypothetical protein [Anaerolineae bacterium]
MSARGTFLRLAYRLRRHLFFNWSLARWLGTLLAIIVAWALIRWWPNFWPGTAFGALLVVYIAWLVWARRSNYLYFEPHPDPATVLDGEPLPPLRKEELVPARASGWFTVESLDGYLVDLEADFETVGTREHIVLARLYRSRFLLLGRWPSYQIGWWYIFFMPDMIRQVGVGHLHAGREPALALQIVYAPDEETEHTIYLVFEDLADLRRVWADLMVDAPPGVVIGDKEHAA